MFESKRRAFIFIILSFILAVIAGVLFYNTLQDLNEDLGEMTEIYIVEDSIPSRESITRDQVTTMEIPNRYVTDKHILSFEQLEGKVSVIPLQDGDLITENMLREFSDFTETGNRVVEMNEGWGNIHFDDKLQNLDRVDIIVSHNLGEEPVTEIFMTDVLVQKILPSEDSGEAVALEVPKEDASELIHMQHYADNIRILKSSTGKSDNAIPATDDAEVEQEDEAEKADEDAA